MTKEMKDIVDDLNTTVGSFTQKLMKFSDDDLRAKPRPGKWSRIEVIGHLIDSAHSNLRRFVTGQYESAPPHITYEQEFWVNANDYQHAPTESIISLWVLMNQRVAAVLTQMPESNYAKSCDTGHEEKSLRTLHWLAADYVRHMKHHLNQVIPDSYNVVYP
jgi:hypothetical protein